MTTIAASQDEIRAIFSNELECLDEYTQALGDFILFHRTIRLQGMNKAEGRTCVSYIVYAIHPDGYWEQCACHNEGWK